RPNGTGCELARGAGKRGSAVRGYTVIENEILDAPATALLTPVQRAVLIDVVRTVKARNGIGLFADFKHPIKPVAFTTAHTSMFIKRETFYRALAEIERKGFAALIRHKGRPNEVQWIGNHLS